MFAAVPKVVVMSSVLKLTRTAEAAGPEAAAAAEANAAYLEHLKVINGTFYDQLKVVDQKAAYVFTFLIAFLVWSGKVRGQLSTVLEPRLEVQWLLAVLLSIAVAVASVSAIMVVFPRNRRGGVSLYWGAWPQAGECLSGLRSGEEFRAVLLEEYRHNVENLAAICRQKYRYVTIAFGGLLVAVLAYIGSVITA